MPELQESSVRLRQKEYIPAILRQTLRKCRAVKSWQRRDRITSVIGAVAMLLSFVVPVSADPTLKGEAQYNKNGDLQTGMGLYKSGDYKAALQCFQNINVPQSQSTVLYYQALCSQQLGNGTNALKLYRRIVATYPKSQEAQLASQYLDKLGSTTGSSHISGRSGALTLPNSSSTGPTGSSGSGSTGSNANASIYSSKNQLPDSCGVPFHRGRAGHMLMNATVGGRTMEVMFDTGAAYCYFGRNQLESIGAKIIPTGQHVHPTGVGGTVDAEICLAEVQLGDIVQTVPLMVATKTDITPLLGQNFFNPFQYDIDTSAGIVHFSKKGSSRRSEGFDTMNVPFTRVGNELQVVASVNGHETTAFFDTGAFGTMFSMSAARSMGLSIPHDARPMMVSGVGGGSIAFRFRVDRVALGPVQKQNMEIVVAPSCPMSLIGQDFFKDKRFTIDNEAQVIKFAR
jgi:clan AA aspartic protease (TIGR02281 family)